MERDGRITSYDWSKYDTRTVVYKTVGLTAEELKQGYDRAYREFYSWNNIFKASFGHDNFKQQLAHLFYMGGWKKFESFWNFMIQYGNLNRMLPMLENLLANTGGHRNKIYKRLNERKYENIETMRLQDNLKIPFSKELVLIAIGISFFCFT